MNKMLALREKIKEEGWTKDNKREYHKQYRRNKRRKQIEIGWCPDFDGQEFTHPPTKTYNIPVYIDGEDIDIDCRIYVLNTVVDHHVVKSILKLPKELITEIIKFVDKVQVKEIVE